MGFLQRWKVNGGSQITLSQSNLYLNFSLEHICSEDFTLLNLFQDWVHQKDRCLSDKTVCWDSHLEQLCSLWLMHQYEGNHKNVRREKITVLSAAQDCLCSFKKYKRNIPLSWISWKKDVWFVGWVFLGGWGWFWCVFCFVFLLWNLINGPSSVCWLIASKKLPFIVL